MKSQKHDDALQKLIDAKIINKNVTIASLLEVTSILDGDDDDDGNIASIWAFIVKGKFIWKDDSVAEEAKTDFD
jgi:hypothetical protein